MRPGPRPQRRQGGVALLEVMIATVILGIGLLGTIGMQARAYSALSDAGQRAEAALAGEKLLGTMTADAANVANYALAEGGQPNTTVGPWVRETQAAIPGAVISVAVTPQARRSRVDINISWTRKAGAAQARQRLTGYIGS
jgi:type IV pilus assembly protein PilV